MDYDGRSGYYRILLRPGDVEKHREILADVSARRKKRAVGTDSVEVVFDVDGVPPKKDLAWSMWSEEGGQRPRVLKLRRAARTAMGDAAPLDGAIALRVQLHVPDGQLMAVGDLDNFVPGICDGLQRAADKWGSETFPEPEWSGIQPNKPCAMVNDAGVVIIDARKLPDGGNKTWYRVALSDDTGPIIEG
jgi:hypothetical protein